MGAGRLGGALPRLYAACQHCSSRFAASAGGGRGSGGGEQAQARRMRAPACTARLCGATAKHALSCAWSVLSRINAAGPARRRGMHGPSRLGS